MPIWCSDDDGRYLSAFTACNALQRFLNYAATLIMLIAGSMKIGKIDCHGGYFRGSFCMNLLYELALYGDDNRDRELMATEERLRHHKISWIAVPSRPDELP